MGEEVGCGLAVLGEFDKLRSLSIFQCGEQAVLLRLSRKSQGSHIERATQHCSLLEHFLTLSGKLADARLNGDSNVLRDPQLLDRRAMPAAILVVQLAAFNQRLTHFLDEEGIPLGLAVNALQ